MWTHSALRFPRPQARRRESTCGQGHVPQDSPLHTESKIRWWGLCVNPE